MVLAKVNRTVIKLLFKRLYGCSAPAEKSVNGANSSHIASSNIKPRSLPRARFFFVQFTVSSGENRVKIKIFRISGRDKEAHGEFI